MRDSEIFGLFIVGSMVLLGYVYSTTPYTEYTVLAVNQTTLSEEFFTVNVYDSKFIPSMNETQIRYIDDYDFLGSPNFKIISLNTTKIIYPNDNLQLKREVVTTDCEYYKHDNNTLTRYTGSLPFIHHFEVKSDFHGDCGKTVFYKLINEKALQNMNSESGK